MLIFVRNKFDLDSIMLKKYIFLLSCLLFFSLGSGAQSVNDLLQRTSEFIAAGKYDQAVASFDQAVRVNADRSEMYYWTSVDKNGSACLQLAQVLASNYKKVHNFDKAYLFYKEILIKKPNEIPTLVECAEATLGRGKDDEAFQIYQHVLQLDIDNLQANIFMGNYYYFKGELEKRGLDADYKKISAPTRMDYARYRNALQKVFNEKYNRARQFLLNVVHQFPSTEASKTIAKIRLIEKEVNK